jgi:hypothetical protein
MQIIIEFLYKYYSKSIMKRTMPPFLAHLGSVYLLIYLSELERSKLKLYDEDYSNVENADAAKEIG